MHQFSLIVWKTFYILPSFSADDEVYLSAKPQVVPFRVVVHILHNFRHKRTLLNIYIISARFNKLHENWTSKVNWPIEFPIPSLLEFLFEHFRFVHNNLSHPFWFLILLNFWLWQVPALDTWLSSSHVHESKKSGFGWTCECSAKFKIYKKLQIKDWFNHN